MRTRSAVIIALSLALHPSSGDAAPQQLPLKHQVEALAPGPSRIENVAEGLYVIRGPFVQCPTCRPKGSGDGLVHEASDVALRVTPIGLVLVDAKYPEYVDDMLGRIRSVSQQPIKYVINTHHHGDHSGGNALFRAMGADILAHSNVRAHLVALREPGEPNLTFTDQAAVFLGGVEVRMLFLGRGHTDGDTVVYFPDLRVVHTGDLVVDGIPIFDYAHGGSALALVATLDKLLAVDFDTAIPGHGPVMRKDDVRAYRARVVELNRRMAALVRARIPKDRAQAALKLEELGWAQSISTKTWAADFGRYYDEIQASIR
jgi:glyoxylase-like metal-dependent hydrolase (beta-lactamase superfamily II)